MFRQDFALHRDDLVEWGKSVLADVLGKGDLDVDETLNVLFDRGGEHDEDGGFILFGDESGQGQEFVFVEGVYERG